MRIPEPNSIQFEPTANANQSLSSKPCSTDPDDVAQMLLKLHGWAEECKQMDGENHMVFTPVSDQISPDSTKVTLFTAKIKNESTLCKSLPTCVKGTLLTRCGEYYFCINMPSVAKCYLQSFTGERLTNIAPLLDYAIKNNLSLLLYGITKRNDYCVHDIALSGDVNPNWIFPKELFNEILFRLRQPFSALPTHSNEINSYAMRSEPEFELFMKICGSRLPAWVIDAYQKEKTTLKRRGISLNDEEKKHALRAQELLLNIDWAPRVPHVPATEEARAILDDDFHGLEEVKVRIEEIVAQIRRTGRLPKWGILLCGPPGVGKTSVAKALAKMLSMEIIQMDMSSLGDDVTAISGSSRIFANACPGMLLNGMFKVHSSTAILLANEVEKAGDSKSGRTAADVLLTILDKTGFYENFLEQIVPTDNLLCIGTCNDLSAISKPLLDRFLVIEIPEYTPADKKVIFQQYVLPLAMRMNNISHEELVVDESFTDLLVAEYAIEPGARDLERFSERIIGDFCRQHSSTVADSEKYVYTVDDIQRLFGPVRKITRHFLIQPGAVNSAFYLDGKAHFFLLEASITPGTGKFEVLGPATKLQQDFCKVAYWCVRNTINKSVIDFSKRDIVVCLTQPIPGDHAYNHIGLACYAAICSKILNRNLALKDIAFIGGVDLFGSTYFEESNLAPLLKAMEAAGVSTLYAPLGCSRLISSDVRQTCNISIVEAPDAQTLFQLAMAQSCPLT